MRRKEKLTLLPNCLPLPVSSHRDAIISFILYNRSILLFFPLHVKGWLANCVCYTKVHMGIDIQYIAIVIVVILISMTLHEAMHGFMAYWLGDDTAKREGRLTLNPIAHIDPFLTLALPIMLAILGAPVFGGAKPVPFNPGRVKYGDLGAALVGLAGPLTNFVLAFIFFAITLLFGMQLTPDSPVLLFLQVAIMVNLGFFVFNMLPIPPLDGSRVLYAIAPAPVQRVMEGIEQFGLIAIFALVLLFNQQLGQVIYGGVTGILKLFLIIFGQPTEI